MCPMCRSVWMMLFDYICFASSQHVWVEKFERWKTYPEWCECYSTNASCWKKRPKISSKKINRVKIWGVYSQCLLHVYVYSMYILQPSRWQYWNISSFAKGDAQDASRAVSSDVHSRCMFYWLNQILNSIMSYYCPDVTKSVLSPTCGEVE